MQFGPNLNTVQVEAYILKLFNDAENWPEFKGNLRDLIISMKKFASRDDAFYQEEREQARQQQEQKEILRR
jgi:hypothetical protein